MEGSKNKNSTSKPVLTAEQEAVLDMYIQHLDDFTSTIKEAEKVQVEIETLHLKKILAK